MKSNTSLVALLVLAVMAGWASVETYRLWAVTQQVTESQQRELRVAAKLEATRARQLQVANVDASARGAGAPNR